MNRSNSRSSLFLMEIMLAVLFFSIAGALCLQMFAKSHQMENDTTNLSMAANHVQSTVELLKHSVSPSRENRTDDFFPECILTEYPHAELNSGTTSIYFDPDWNHCEKTQGAFCMEITPPETEDIKEAEDSGLFCRTISVYKTGVKEPVYSFDLKLHIPNRP
ncbi:MAG: hypothetical protein HFG80_14620 [Eubacterium sp.]|jgi:hypothetical protein|nr:hypothetical protein [Eubacterium sp.]